MTDVFAKARLLPLQIPLLTLLMLALAASTLVVLTREAPLTRPGYAVAGDAPAKSTAYGSSAALRNLLF